MLKKNKPVFSILFVCAVNTTRSPALKGAMQSLLKNKGLEREVYVESAGLQPFCPGSSPDIKMQKIAQSHGVVIDDHSKLFESSYFDAFNVIFCVSKDIVSAIHQMARTEQEANKVFIATQFSVENPMKDIPYPDYNNSQAVDEIWKQIVNACLGIYNHFLSKKQKRS